MHPRRTAALVVLAALLAACAPRGAGDDPVMTPPEGMSTDGPADDELGDDGATEAPAEATTPDGEDDVTPQGWVERAAAPVALTEIAAAPFGGSVWTAGGLGEDGEAVGSVLIYDPTFDGWEEGPSLPQTVHHSALVAAGQDALVLLGGYVGSSFDAPTADVLVLDATTGEWTAGPALPAPRAAGAAAWDGSRLVYGGGVGPDGLEGDVWALEGEAWVSVGVLSEPREHLAGASDGDGRVWFLGGRTAGFDTNLGTIDLVEGDALTTLGDLPTPRGGLAGLHLPGVGACALGGEGTTGTFDEVECIDADGAVTVLPPLALARHGLGAVVLEETAYAVLGGPEPGLFVSAAIEALRLDR